MSGILSRRGFVAAAGGLAPAAALGLIDTDGRMTAVDAQTVADRAAIIDVVNRIGTAADWREWEACRACFADAVRVDYTSLWGGEASTTGADELIAGWARTFAGFDATQHAITSHDVRVDGGAAVCRSHFVATHRIGAELWRLGGHYRHELARDGAAWKVTAMTMAWTWEEGDRGLIRRANERGSALNL